MMPIHESMEWEAAGEQECFLHHAGRGEEEGERQQKCQPHHFIKGREEEKRGENALNRPGGINETSLLQGKKEREGGRGA